MIGWLSVISVLFGCGPASPSPSSPEPLSCRWISKGDTLRATRNTIMYVFPSCGRGLMNREEMIESMACEDRVRELRRQGQRLQQRLLAAHDTVFVCGPADVLVGIEAHDGTVTSVPLAKHADDFFGTVLLAPKRPPARLLGQNSDEDFVRFVAAYFQ